MLMDILKQPSLDDAGYVKGHRQRMGVAEIRLLRAAFAGEHEDIMMAMLMQNTSEEEVGWDNRR
ncbi:hypothetical protein AWENTII_006805 [Aspergillus wentii]